MLLTNNPEKTECEWKDEPLLPEHWLSNTGSHGDQAGNDQTPH